MSEPGPWAYTEGLDTWDRIGDDRVCSFCGSMHPVDFEQFLKRVIDDPDPQVRLSHSDKQYKVYVKRPEIQNASEGAIKYYKQHTNQLDTADKERLQQVYIQALHFSRDKWSRYLGVER